MSPMSTTFELPVLPTAILSLCIGAVVMYTVMTLQLKKKDPKKEKKERSNNVDNYSIIDPNQPKRKPIRVYIDGCWDVMHSGHYNALRQAKALGDILVVGVHSNEEIARNKRWPVMNNEQRMATVTACKWADEVVFGVPYSPDMDLLAKLNCDFVAHGDDIPINENGQHCFHAVLDKLKVFRRTPGVSTTHLIQRLLDAVKYTNGNEKEITPRKENKTNAFCRVTATTSDDQKESLESTASWSSFLSSASRIRAFSNNKIPAKEDTVVFVDGIFDLFHQGHIAALKKAKELGDFLYVGLYDDKVVQSRLGPYFPLMNLQERVLNVLSCKYVDDVIIGSPWKITPQVLKVLNISYVVVTPNTKFCEEEFDRYQVAKEMGIFKELVPECKFTTQDLMDRIVNEQDQLEKQNKNRVEKAKKYVQQQTYVQEQMD